MTTAETWSTWLAHPGLVAAVDRVSAHVHPYWDGVAIDGALAYLEQRVGALRSLAGTKPVLVAETGWPTCGPARGACVPSLANSLRYFRQVASWSRESGVPCFWFEALDEPFKANYEGPAGACWGYRDASGQLKLGFEAFFQGIRTR